MRLSIRSVALLNMWIPLLVLALALGTYFIRLRLADVRIQLETTATRSAEYLAETGRFPLLVGDQQGLLALAESGIGAAQDAVAVVFLEADGRRMATAGTDGEVELAGLCQGRPQQCLQQQRYLQVRDIRGSPVEPLSELQLDAAEQEEPTAVDQPPLLGQVLVSFDLRRLRALEQDMLMDGVVMTATASLVMFLLAFLFARRLTGPIRGLSQVVTRIQSGDLAARTRPIGSGELRELEDGVNSMAQRVEEANEMLQRRINEATGELSRTLHDLEQRNSDLDAARQRAEEASQAKDLFLARMSHELRTPLASVVGFAKLLKEEQSPQRRRQFAELVDSGAGLLTATIDDILNFVKLQSGSLQLEQREFDLPGCLESVVILQGPSAHARNLELDCLLDNELPQRVMGDSVRLSQILNNLLSNAVKFTRSGGVQVAVSASAAGEAYCWLDITVSDSGIGIEDSDQEQLFEPFVQADESTTRRFGGSGLGLSISRRLARLMGGEVSLSSHPGEGTRAHARVRLQVLASASRLAVRRDSLELLLIDGTPACAASVAHYLAAWRPQLSHMESTAALRRLESWTPDLLILADCIAGQAQLRDVRTVYQGPLLLLLRESEPGRVLQSLPDANIPTLIRPVQRDALRGVVTRLLSGRSERQAESLPPQLSAFRCSVLVAEDNDLNRRLISEQLQRLGVRFQAVADATAALTAAGDEFFDLMLMDVHMPGMTGVELASELRQLVPQLPVYALTANVVGTEEAMLKAAGVRDILFKPLQEQVLLNLLREHGEYDVPAVAEASASYETSMWMPERSVVQQEILRLLASLEDAFGGGSVVAAADCAHKLLGVVRIGARDDLLPLAIDLDQALRQQDLAEADAVIASLNRQLIA